MSAQVRAGYIAGTESSEGAFFTCPACEGHGAKVERHGGAKVAVLCKACDGEGRRWATPDMIEDAAAIGSDNPFCAHEWSYTGTVYGGGDASYHGEGRCYCVYCGADGDA